METCSNTLLGFIGSFVITTLWMTYSSFDKVTTSLMIVISCTAWSLVRGYYVRRAFNKLWQG